MAKAKGVRTEAAVVLGEFVRAACRLARARASGDYEFLSKHFQRICGEFDNAYEAYARHAAAVRGKRGR